MAEKHHTDSDDVIKRRPRALRYRTGKVRKVAHRTADAAACLGRLTPGIRVTGVTAGQFSAIDALEHMANELGAATARVSTWTTGIYDVQRAADLRRNGNIKEILMLLDRGTFTKSPQFAGPLIDAIGVDGIRCLSVHAKVIVIDGDRGSAVFRSSMNLNKNLRTEQFDLDVCDEVAGFYREWFDALWVASGKTQNNAEIIEEVYERFKHGVIEPPARRGKMVANPWASAT